MTFGSQVSRNEAYLNLLLIESGTEWGRSGDGVGTEWGRTRLRTDSGRTPDGLRTDSGWAIRRATTRLCEASHRGPQ